MKKEYATMAEEYKQFKLEKQTPVEEKPEEDSFKDDQEDIEPVPMTIQEMS